MKTIDIIEKGIKIYFSSIFSKMKPYPLIVYLEVTRKCNLNCIACNVKNNYPKGRKDMSLQEIKTLIDDFAKNGVVLINISGGEPFLRDDIFDIIKMIKLSGMSVHISSNGILITKEVAKKIIESKVDSINISIDSPIEEVHNKIRGGFTKAIEGINNLSGLDICLTIQTVVRNENLDDFDMIVDLAKELRIDGVRLLPIHMNLVGGGHKKKEYISRICRKDIPVLIKTMERFKKKIKLNYMHTNSEDYLNGIIRFFNDIPRFRCFSLSILCEINTWGDIFPCYAGKLHSIGNLRTNNFNTIWNSNLANRTREEVKKCSECWVACYVEPSLRFSPRHIFSTLRNIRNDIEIIG